MTGSVETQPDVSGDGDIPLEAYQMGSNCCFAVIFVAPDRCRDGKLYAVKLEAFQSIPRLALK